ncbi:hypothetical protein LguiA_012979 [Lonicera macranthoides]
MELLETAYCNGIYDLYLYPHSCKSMDSNGAGLEIIREDFPYLLEYEIETFNGIRLVCYSLRDIKDPEHPYSLEELKVISEEAVEVNDENSHVRVTFTPTVEHCSMATVIGLCLRVKLMRSLPSRYKAFHVSILLP